jgi:hypothetical protein
VREIARALADGTWRPDRPPGTVLDIVRARVDRVSPACRRFVQAAAIVGRDFSLTLVAAALRELAGDCLGPVDEAIAFGLIDQVGASGDYRFVHALTREAVEASLTTAARVSLHRAVADAIEATFAGDLSEHLNDIARHWAPYGEAETARAWAIRAADDAVRRLAYEDGVRLYRAALAVDSASLPGLERSRVLVALGRAAYLAGDLHACAEAAVAAAGAASAAGSRELLAEAALVAEVTADRQRGRRPAPRAGRNRARRSRPRGATRQTARPEKPPLVLRRRPRSRGRPERSRPRPRALLRGWPRPRRGPARAQGGVPGTKPPGGPHGAGVGDARTRTAYWKRPHRHVGRAVADRGLDRRRRPGGGGRSPCPPSGRRRAGRRTGRCLALRPHRRGHRPGPGPLRRRGSHRSSRLRADAGGRAGPGARDLLFPSGRRATVRLESDQSARSKRISRPSAQA